VWVCGNLVVGGPFYIRFHHQQQRTAERGVQGLALSTSSRVGLVATTTTWMMFLNNFFKPTNKHAYVISRTCPGRREMLSGQQHRGLSLPSLHYFIFIIEQLFFFFLAPM